MESLTDNEEKPSKKNADRVTLGREESEKVQGWVKQLSDVSKGLLSLTKSDLINFLIRDHKVDLSSKQIQQLRVDNYDPIRHINWIVPRVKQAWLNKDHALVATLQSELRSLELSVIESAARGESVKARAATGNSRKKVKSKSFSDGKPVNRVEDLQSENTMTADDED